MLCISGHQKSPIIQICLKSDCRSFPTVCEACLHEHQDKDKHDLIPVAKFKQSLSKFADSQPKNDKNHKEVPKLENNVMQGNLECSAQAIFRLNQRLQRMAQFMNTMHSTMTQVETQGEEQDLVNHILYQLSNTNDLPTLNRQFSSMFLLMQPVKDTNPQTKKNQLKLAPTAISNIRTHSVLSRMQEFTEELKNNIEQQELTFADMLAEMGKLMKENRHLINLELATQATGGGIQELGIPVKCEDRDAFRKKILYRDLLMVREILGIEECDRIEPFHGQNKQMMKLCNYWVFYYNVQCYGTLQEPRQETIPIKKGKKVFPAVRCTFCKLINHKDFMNSYYRYEPIKKFGELCLFVDDDGKEIAAHEMCLLWSNRVSITLQTYHVDLNSILMAAQYARTQQCRYCGCLGASLKCNRPECHVHFHFSCLKQVRLMGMQLDFEAKFRFFCEEHVIRINQYESDWFITRIRLMHLIQGENQLIPQGQGKFSKHEEEDYDDESQAYHSQEPRTRKRVKQQDD